MKQTVKLLTMILAIGSLTVFMSCGKDDGGIVIDTDLTISFSTTTATVAEGESVTVTVSFPAAPVDATITAMVDAANTTATYSTDYTTDPAVSSDLVSVSIVKGATSATFSFAAVADDEDESDETVKFDLQSAEGIELGSNTSFTVTITDVISYDDISSLGGLVEGTEVRVKGVVTTPDYGFSHGQYFIQDGTGGINIFHAGNQGLVVKGNEVVIEGTTGSFGDALQLNPTSVTVLNASATIPTASSIDETGVTTSNTLQGSLVTLSNVSFTEDEWPSEAISSGSAVNVSAMVGSTPFQIRIDRGESFYDGSPVPGEPLTVTGVLTRNGDDVQIMPFVDGDVVSNGTLGVLTITESLTAFDATANGSISSEQSFTVSGTDIVGDVTITSSQYFTISTQSEEVVRGATTSFSNEVVLTDVSSAQTIYVRFEPSSGTDQTLNGSISISASNALSEDISISGEETGNGTVAVGLLQEDFDYGASAGALTTVSAGNWVNHSGTAETLAYTPNGLSLTGYVASGVGGAADVSGTSEDANRSFAVQSTGTFYAAALVNVSSANAGGGNYFLHLMDDGFGFVARVYGQDDGSGNLNFGIRAVSGSTTAFSSTSYSYNTTYLLVIKFNADTGQSDLFVLSSVATTEPSSPDATSNDGSAKDNVQAIGIRQSSGIPVAMVDGIVVTTDWSDFIAD